MALTYHDLHITTARIPRTSISNLPFRIEVSCSRVGGWLVIANPERAPEPLPYEILGGDGRPMRLDVDGHVIFDTLTKWESDNGRKTQ